MSYIPLISSGVAGPLGVVHLPRLWVGERLVFRMPYATFMRITKARTFAIKFDGVEFSVGETQKQALSELLNYMKVTKIIAAPTPR